MSGGAHHALELTAPAGDPDSPVHRLDPRAKIVGLVTVTLVAVSAPLSAWPVLAACALALAAVAAPARVPPAALWQRVRVVLPLVIVVGVFLPFVRTGGERWKLGPLTVHEQGLEVLGAVASKATIGALSAALLLATTGFPAVLRGLDALRVPRVFVLITGFTYRYLFVVAAEVGRMRAAVMARGYAPRTMLRSGAMGRVAGALFLRTHARGERVHRAMLARGWSGSMPQLSPLALRAADGAFVAAILIPLVALRVALGVAA